VNNYYYNLLFSLSPVTKDALAKYQDFMKRRQGVEHQDWYYINGAVPVADSSNPQLFRKGLIFCGTIAGFMDPFAWFGITGALISGKIAAMAVSEPNKAQAEFVRFSKYYTRALYFKNYLWYPLLRPNVGMLEKAINLIGPQRVSKLLASFIYEERHTPFAIPGYAHLGACY
jgi:flavin-dependent dehydrogenase